MFLRRAISRIGCVMFAVGSFVRRKAYLILTPPIATSWWVLESREVPPPGAVNAKGFGQQPDGLAVVS
jgi:hypothetical protein